MVKTERKRKNQAVELILDLVVSFQWIKLKKDERSNIFETARTVDRLITNTKAT